MNKRDTDRTTYLSSGDDEVELSKELELRL